MESLIYFFHKNLLFLNGNNKENNTPLFIRVFYPRHINIYCMDNITFYHNRYAFGLCERKIGGYILPDYRV